ncbi:hypothetical protein DL766_004657 [Monosporascus sp. MC13-8B]|uniref:TauD/TfdA-like domain-containing protein n=1 Tax=Monosporascus cannonballus TaxID=155416 RepID=A0ABY0HEM3_9PEZI|nr:hypothetical protein DL763_007971 [Monosporascus cannonballus]RYO91440.1 hypothetical protein DL762_002166 [Monosporascus cannonballus]RYP30938.1 hypothetical protein DL766_004657 [Monosporascus sp. MC13-8B]
MAQSSHRKPLQLSGALDKFSYEDSTPEIGREFLNVNIVDDLIKAQNADDILRDLAITISQRGVVFFRAQDNLTDELQKEFVHRLGQLAGKPDTSTLHIFPLAPAFVPESGTADRQISYVNSVGFKYMFEKMPTMDKRRFDAAEWHSDIQFERVPADYTSLRVIKLPKTGGDTLWASGYELYNRLSKTYQDFVDGLSVTCRADCVLMAMQHKGEKIEEGERGSPLNVGSALAAVHPVVRTHPVTGWRSIFSVGQFSKRINEVNLQESDELLKKFYSMIQENHDLQVRFKWRFPNDVAIWDNRCTFHRATFDYLGLGERFGNRAVGIGEIPYFDPESKSRDEALGVKKAENHGVANESANGGSHGGHGMTHGSHGMGQGGANGHDRAAH